MKINPKKRELKLRKKLKLLKIIKLNQILTEFNK